MYGGSAWSSGHWQAESQLGVIFGGDNHPTDPRGGPIPWQSFRHFQMNISVQAVLHLLGPVYRNGGRGVNSCLFDSLVHEQPHRGADLH